MLLKRKSKTAVVQQNASALFKLCIVCTHPIQYNAPWFSLLSKQPNIVVKVFYTWSQSKEGPKYDPGFGKIITWDIPLLEGYDFSFVHNAAADPGSHHFKGIDNPTLIKDIENWGPHAVLVFGWAYKSHLSVMRYFKNKIPVWFRGDSTLLNEKRGVKQIVRRLFLKYVYSFIDVALYVGTNNKNYYLAHGVKESQLHFVPHAIDNKRFRNENESSKEKAKILRNELGISSNEIVLLYAGKFETVKNPEYLLELGKHYNDKNIRFVLVGNGPLEDQLKIATENDRRFIFIDFQNQKQMPVIYHLADLFVLPSKSETWGLAINEAMVCGKPILASSNVGCAIDLIKENENGLVFKNNDFNSIISFLKKVTENKQLLLNMGIKSQKIIQPFSFETIVNNIETKISQIGQHA